MFLIHMLSMCLCFAQSAPLLQLTSSVSIHAVATVVTPKVVSCLKLIAVLGMGRSGGTGHQGCSFLLRTTELIPPWSVTLASSAGCYSRNPSTSSWSCWAMPQQGHELELPGCWMAALQNRKLGLTGQTHNFWRHRCWISHGPWTLSLLWRRPVHPGRNVGGIYTPVLVLKNHASYLCSITSSAVMTLYTYQ